MKAYTVLFLIIITGSSFAQDVKPFSELISQVRKNDGWTLNRRENALLLYRERKRLGDKFVPELLKFIDGDIDRHYNAAIFLSEPYYLGKEKPMNETALLIYHQGIALTQRSTDQMKKSDELPLRVFASILSQRMGYKSLAVYHRSMAEILIQSGEYEGCFPAIDDSDRKIFNDIKIDQNYYRNLNSCEVH